MKIQMLNGEYWYGSCVKYGLNMPIGETTDLVFDMTVNQTPNQAMPLFLSTKGRHIWYNKGFKASFRKGIIDVPDECILSETGGNLRSAYLDAKEKYFPFSSKTPNKITSQRFSSKISCSSCDGSSINSVCCKW